MSPLGVECILHVESRTQRSFPKRDKTIASSSALLRKLRFPFTTMKDALKEAALQ